MSFIKKIRALFHSRKFESDMDEEMRSHLEMQEERLRAAGAGVDEARWKAQRQFGGVEQIKEQCRDQRGWVKLELAWKEIGFACRALRRAPGFTIAVLTTLALCIGPNTAIFSAVYTLVYKPLPFPESERLVSISNVAERSGGAKRPSSVAQHADFAANADRFEGFGYFSATNATVGGEDTPVRVAGMRVSANLLTLLGVRPQLGRFFAAEEQTPGKERVVVLSHFAWTTRYNSDPAIVGREIRMEGLPYTVIGVAERSFEEIFNDVEFFQPYVIWPDDLKPMTRYAGSVRLVGKLKRGVPIEAGRAQLAVLEKAFYDRLADPQARAALENAGLRLAVNPAREELAEPIKAPLLLLQGGAALVLLIGCVNVASLVLARATAKRPELAIRHALGAGRATLLRQLLAESFLLVSLAGAAGVGVAAAMLRFMNHYLSTFVRHVPPILMDGHAIAMVGAVVALLGVVMGLVPFVWLWRGGLGSAETPHASAGRRSRAALGALVVGQVAVALVLLIGAGLLIHSFARVMAVKPGFDAERIVQGRVNLPGVRYKEGKDTVAMQQRILAAMKEIPGVEAAALTLDFGVQNFVAVPFLLRDAQKPSEGAQPLVHLNRVSSDYFATMGIALREGRVFRDDDVSGKSLVVLVDQTFAERYFPDGNALGQEIAIGAKAPAAGAPWWRIVGVVARANLEGLEKRDGWPFVYLPFNQQPSTGFTFLVRSPRLEADITGEMRARVRAIDPALPVFATGTLQAGLDAMLGNRRALMFLLGTFAALALALAGVGLYGVLNYDVSQRTREIGIRGAIGATRRQIVAMILRQGLTRAAVGLGTGLIGAFFFTRLLRKMLFEISATDPVAYGGVAGLLLLVALLASWLPARRAAKVDPIVALRCE